MTKVPILEEEITIVNIYEAITGTFGYLKKTLLDLIGDSCRIIDGDFDTPGSSMNRSIHQ
jgi:hypothetical protein